jgi:glycosyltransferase involved in cell wall biosynthesis
MKNLKELTVFLTRNYSLNTWKKNGLFEREIYFYKKLLKYNIKTSFVSYGGIEDRKLLNKKKLSFKVYYRHKWIPKLVYSFLIPIIHFNAIKKTNIIKSHQVKGSLEASLCSLIFNKPYIARNGFILSFPRSRLPNLLINKFIIFIEELISFKLSSYILTPSRSDKNYISNQYRINKKKIMIHPNFVDINLFKKKTKIRNTSGIKFKSKKKSINILFVGRLVDSKQPLLLVDILKDFKNLKLIVVGDGPLKKKLTIKCKKNKLDLQLAGRVNNHDLSFFYNYADIFLFPTLYEGGSSKVLIEAMSCKLPIISSNVFAVNDLISTKKNGLLSNSKSITSFRKNINLLLKNNKLRKKLIENAYKDVINKYQFSKFFERELKIIKKL